MVTVMVGFRVCGVCVNEREIFIFMTNTSYENQNSDLCPKLCPLRTLNLERMLFPFKLNDRNILT